MKPFASPILMITICTLTFLSCSKKQDVASSPGKNSIVFWTKNTALLTACSNNIAIRLVFPGLYSGLIGDSAHIINVNASAPSSCSNMPSAIENISGIFCGYQIKDCATGLWSNIDTLNLVTGVCRKIEIP